MEEPWAATTTSICVKGAGPSTSAVPPSSKRAKTDKQAAKRKLYFMWRGRETGENEIQLDHTGENHGEIVCLDATCSRFRGNLSGGCVGSNVEFEGYKTSSEATDLVNTWEDYSEDVYEEERKARSH